MKKQTKLEVFYDPRMSADSGGYSPSAAKPALVVADWVGRGLPIDLVSFAPVSTAAIKLAHDSDYVDDVLNLNCDNGHGNRSASVANTLPWTLGSMVAAAERAVAICGPTCSPTSGFHHAGSSSGGGFCTFNGLMVAALSLYADDLVDRVAIIDYDYHPGNGTDDIIFRLGCEDWCLHVDTAWGDRSTDFLAEMDRSLARVAAFRPDLVLYQAGADMWIDDPLGGMLTIDELRQRDLAVFEMCHRHSLPIVWNLAGGYAREPDGSIPKVLEIHRGTAENCLKIFGSL